jgi:hypothetical protein
MTPKEIIVALALLLSATSATLAMSHNPSNNQSNNTYTTSGYNPGESYTR